MKEKISNGKKKNWLSLLLAFCMLVVLMSEVATAIENINITGVLVQGVESGCIILNGDDGKIYQLFNLSNGIPPFGSKVYINGTIGHNIISYCMQGTSVKVSSMTIIGYGDILSFYRGLGKYPDIVETNDLLKAADDWRNNVIPPGFSSSISTGQLLILAEEWRNSK